MPVRPPPVEEFCHVMARKLGLLCKEWHNLSQNQVWASFLKVTQFELNEPKLSSHKQKTRMSIWLDQTLSSPVNLSMFFFFEYFGVFKKGTFNSTNCVRKIGQFSNPLHLFRTFVTKSYTLNLLWRWVIPRKKFSGRALSWPWQGPRIFIRTIINS